MLAKANKLLFPQKVNFLKDVTFCTRFIDGSCFTVGIEDKLMSIYDFGAPSRFTEEGIFFMATQHLKDEEIKHLGYGILNLPEKTYLLATVCAKSQVLLEKLRVPKKMELTEMQTESGPLVLNQKIQDVWRNMYQTKKITDPTPKDAEEANERGKLLLEMAQIHVNQIPQLMLELGTARMRLRDPHVDQIKYKNRFDLMFSEPTPEITEKYINMVVGLTAPTTKQGLFGETYSVDQTKIGFTLLRKLERERNEKKLQAEHNNYIDRKIGFKKTMTDVFQAMKTENVPRPQGNTQRQVQPQVKVTQSVPSQRTI